MFAVKTMSFLMGHVACPVAQERVGCFVLTIKLVIWKSQMLAIAIAIAIHSCSNIFSYTEQVYSFVDITKTNYNTAILPC